MARASYFKRNDNDARCVLDQHGKLDLYSASWLKQQSTGRNLDALKHIILIPSQPAFVLTL